MLDAAEAELHPPQSEESSLSRRVEGEGRGSYAPSTPRESTCQYPTLLRVATDGVCSDSAVEISRELGADLDLAGFGLGLYLHFV